MTNIVCFTLSSGEMIIGSQIDSSNTTKSEFIPDQDDFFIEDPAQLIMQHVGEGRMGLSLIPYAPFSDGNPVRFLTKAVNSIFTPSRDVLNEYSRMFGSGIQIADATSIMH
jgi:hypothetical protein